MVYPRQVLNQLKWGPSGGLDNAEVTYLHRGAPGDELTVPGSEIVGLERSFFCIGESKVPYHRIKRIVLDGEVLYDSGLRKGDR
ncbi:MAG TPA: RNA repair domain-containing protein [Methanomassiliicoccales archaeon]|nr:RNA repair domain-containing protein [Methanomassiliicoccales archaeon]